MVLLFKVLVVDLLHAEATILGSVCTNMQKMDNVHVIVWTTTWMHRQMVVGKAGIMRF